MSATAKETEWLLPSVAARMLATSIATLAKNAALMSIRVRRIPGSEWRRYHADDVRRAKETLERDEAAAIQQAQAGAGAGRRPRRPGPGRPRKQEANPAG